MLQEKYTIPVDYGWDTYSLTTYIRAYEHFI